MTGGSKGCGVVQLVGIQAVSEPVSTVADSSSWVLGAVGIVLMIVGLLVSTALVSRGRYWWALSPILPASIPFFVALTIDSGFLVGFVGVLMIDCYTWALAYGNGSGEVFVKRDWDDIKDLFSWIPRKHRREDFRGPRF
ncbi:hypothetical protein [Gordonia shandongensis]|uniref:hypothetical protein n=1 Tax=Gordonia shandongensis TaxID=376351 RepID=UPI0012EBE292|nr:hypothetical protein [Gordonia shandongensis]